MGILPRLSFPCPLQFETQIHHHLQQLIVNLLIEIWIALFMWSTYIIWIESCRRCGFCVSTSSGYGGSNALLDVIPRCHIVKIGHKIQELEDIFGCRDEKGREIVELVNRIIKYTIKV